MLRPIRRFESDSQFTFDTGGGTQHSPSRCKRLVAIRHPAKSLPIFKVRSVSTMIRYKEPISPFRSTTSPKRTTLTMRWSLAGTKRRCLR